MNAVDTCIGKFYRSRTEFRHFDDTAKKDEWQLEVYLHALGLMIKHKYNRIIDVGCGSGFKLVNYLGQYDALGIEVDATYQFLKSKYPDGQWMSVDEAKQTPLKADVVICADVIEHVLNPDQVADFLKGIQFQHLIISTPARELIYKPWQRAYWGPPANPHHVREWTRKEFYRYLSRHFDVQEHRVTNYEQATQMAVCCAKKSSAAA